MRKRITCALLTMLSMISLTAFAEDFRVWSDQNGHTVEAKFIQMSGPKVVLERTDGKRLMVPKSGLCMADQEYLAGAIPPQLKITVDKDVDKVKLAEGGGYSYSYEQKKELIDMNVTIEKVNKDKCSRSFKATLYILAESKAGDRRKVLTHEDRSFSFENSDTIHFSGSAEVTSSEWSGYSSGSERGWEYEGYLVVVEDDKGDVVAIETSKSTYETNLKRIRDNVDKDDFKL